MSDPYPAKKRDEDEEPSREDRSIVVLLAITALALAAVLAAAAIEGHF